MKVFSVRRQHGLDAVIHLHVFKAILLTDATQHVLLTTLLHLASNEQLIQDKVGFLKVEDYVELANVSVVFVHLLDVSMDDLESDEFIVSRIATGDEEEGSITAIDDFGI